MELISQTQKHQKIIDSLGYTKQHQNPKSVLDQVQLFSEKLTKIGYLQNRFSDYKKTNDSTFLFECNLGQKTDYLKISTSKSEILKDLQIVQSDTITLSFSETENFMQSVMQQLERKGYAMSKIKLDNFSFEKNILKADLLEEISSVRKLDDVVVMGYDKFPEGYRKQLKRMYKNRIFNEQTVKELHQDIQKFTFVNSIRQPEILFAQDSTRIFLYLEKAKSSSFDGYVGFTTDENDKVVFMGFVDLLLSNALNTGEQFKIYWKSDGNDQQTFDFSAELPYIFNTPLALRGNLNIFKQDSTFQTTKTNLDVGYYFKYNTRAYVGYSSSSSNDIQNSSASNLNDFKSKFFTSSFEYFDLNREDFLFPEKRNIVLKGGVGNRTATLDKNSQFFVHLKGFNNFYLNQKNSVNIKFDAYFLESDTYLINELYRFGGINSIRGFNENSLQGNFFSGLMLEYRYLLAPSLYVHTITDYGHFQDKATQINRNLLGLGFGLGLYTNNGLFNIVYANGSIDSQEIKMSNSIVHLSFKANF